MMTDSCNLLRISAFVHLGIWRRHVSWYLRGPSPEFQRSCSLQHRRGHALLRASSKRPLQLGFLPVRLFFMNNPEPRLRACTTIHLPDLNRQNCKSKQRWRRDGYINLLECSLSLATWWNDEKKSMTKTVHKWRLNQSAMIRGVTSPGIAECI
jgi:hypothetical protein